MNICDHLLSNNVLIKATPITITTAIEKNTPIIAKTIKASNKNVANDDTMDIVISPFLKYNRKKKSPC